VKRLAALVLAVAAVPLDSSAQIVLRDDRGVTLQLDAVPARIVSLLPSLTETVCSLGHCVRLVGTDRYSNWPASVKSLPKLGGLDDAQIERIVALEPDLVLAAGSSRALERLESLGLRVLALEPKSLADTQRVIRTLAHALGDAAAADALWASLEARTHAAAVRVPQALRGQRVYVEVDPAPYAAGEASFVGETLTRLGLANVVPAALGAFPKLNPEYVVRVQPDIVIAGSAALADMARRPGWSTLRALRAQRSCGFGPDEWDLIVRPGPRLADAAELLAGCFAKLGDRLPAPR
jgi:iron complex transport system substrate-binding protein